MTEITKYKCDCCGTEYSDEQECIECENSHAQVEPDKCVVKYNQDKELPYCIYMPFKDDNDKYFVVLYRLASFDTYTKETAEKIENELNEGN